MKYKYQTSFNWYFKIPYFLLVWWILSGCATKPYDYTNFKKYKPESILVIPPLNQSTDLRATYSCLSSMTYPIAEMGYYVFPVAVIDEMLKQNGLPTAGEMHQASLQKIAEIINPDAVLYVTVEKYGSYFQIFASSNQVALHAKLIHTKTGTLLWEGIGKAIDSSDTNGSLAAVVAKAVITQMINDASDASFNLCRMANQEMFTLKNHGLLPGPYHPQHHID